jgi:hypothetical protein
VGVARETLFAAELMQNLIERARNESWVICGNTIRSERKPPRRTRCVPNLLQLYHLGRLFDEIVADGRHFSTEGT